ncbi:hypothetical protein PAPYR_6082 [Paratrimastix pyriformis]|uniref:Uncharacterized protein n=1 Tax=Paratrimastix pyriformis TaxID=342808 RepID=A0ABQ8UG75_9EUKA|nr:hypothetical protein PAPYR_6082 [Paratrimastix pyriformis]
MPRGPFFFWTDDSYFYRVKKSLIFSSSHARGNTIWSTDLHSELLFAGKVSVGTKSLFALALRDGVTFWEESTSQPGFQRWFDVSAPSSSGWIGFCWHPDNSGTFATVSSNHLSFLQLAGSPPAVMSLGQSCQLSQPQLTSPLHMAWTSTGTYLAISTRTEIRMISFTSGQLPRQECVFVPGHIICSLMAAPPVESAATEGRFLVIGTEPLRLGDEEDAPGAEPLDAPMLPPAPRRPAARAGETSDNGAPVVIRDRRPPPPPEGDADIDITPSIPAMFLLQNGNADRTSLPEEFPAIPGGVGDGDGGSPMPGTFPSPTGSVDLPSTTPQPSPPSAGLVSYTPTPPPQVGSSPPVSSTPTSLTLSDLSASPPPPPPPGSLCLSPDLTPAQSRAAAILAALPEVVSTEHEVVEGMSTAEMEVLIRARMKSRRATRRPAVIRHMFGRRSEMGVDARGGSGSGGMSALPPRLGPCVSLIGRLPSADPHRRACWGTLSTVPLEGAAPVGGTRPLGESDLLGALLATPDLCALDPGHRLLAVGSSTLPAAFLFRLVVDEARPRGDDGLPRVVPLGATVFRDFHEHAPTHWPDNLSVHVQPFPRESLCLGLAWRPASGESTSPRLVSLIRPLGKEQKPDAEGPALVELGLPEAGRVIPPEIATLPPRPSLGQAPAASDPITSRLDCLIDLMRTLTQREKRFGSSLFDGIFTIGHPLTHCKTRIRSNLNSAMVLFQEVAFPVKSFFVRDYIVWGLQRRPVGLKFRSFLAVPFSSRPSLAPVPLGTHFRLWYVSTVLRAY